MGKFNNIQRPTLTVRQWTISENSLQVQAKFGTVLTPRRRSLKMCSTVSTGRMLLLGRWWAGCEGRGKNVATRAFTPSDCGGAKGSERCGTTDANLRRRFIDVDTYNFVEGHNTRELNRTLRGQIDDFCHRIQISCQRDQILCLSQRERSSLIPLALGLW